MVSLGRLNGSSVGAFSKILRTNCNSDFLKHNPNYLIRSLRNNCSSIEASNDKKFDDSKYSQSLKDGVIPKHVVIILDGNRRWLKARGLKLDYKPYLIAEMKFVDYCLKWGIGTATSYVYGLGNVEKRTKVHASVSSFFCYFRF